MTRDQGDPFKPFFERLAAPNGVQARALFGYWRSLATPPALPARTQIAMDELARLGCLDSVFIVEPIDGGRDWKYRLLGTRIVDLYGAEVTNIPFRDHMTSAEADEAIALSNSVRESRAPLFLRARFVSGTYSTPIETMSLPITGRDADDIWLFGGTFFTSR